MSGPDNFSVCVRRTRRNVLKIGAIFAPAVLAKAKPARAATGVCGSSIGPLLCKCFLKGTKIRTVVNGYEKVEDLAVGDFLPTMFGGLRPIEWIGRYSLEKNDLSEGWAKEALPVRIKRSALAPDVPHDDLYVTRTHALFIDGVLVSAESLINDTTITLFEAREYHKLEYFHIKLESHDVIYAENAPVETLLNVGDTAVNFGEYVRNYGSPKTDEAPCAPLISYGGGRRELKSRLRSAVSPWTDSRGQFEVIRDRLEERGIALFRQREPAL
jgi:hypothetical protein